MVVKIKCQGCIVETGAIIGQLLTPLFLFFGELLNPDQAAYARRPSGFFASEKRHKIIPNLFRVFGQTSHEQTVQTQIRHHRKWQVTRVYTVCHLSSTFIGSKQSVQILGNELKCLNNLTLSLPQAIIIGFCKQHRSR